MSSAQEHNLDSGEGASACMSSTDVALKAQILMPFSLIASDTVFTFQYHYYLNSPPFIFQVLIFISRALARPSMDQFTAAEPLLQWHTALHYSSFTTFSIQHKKLLLHWVDQDIKTTRSDPTADTRTSAEPEGTRTETTVGKGTCSVSLGKMFHVPKETNVELNFCQRR